MSSLWPFQRSKKRVADIKAAIRKEFQSTLRCQIATKLRDQGVLPVLVRESTDPDDYDGMVFDGTESEYLEIIKELNVRTVFVTSKIFTEDHLQFALEYSVTELEPAEKKKLLKAIESARKHIGDECELRLIVRASEFELNFHHVESWWAEFISAEQTAMDQLETIESARVENEAQALDNRRAHLLAEINELIRDENFVRLPTQRAMFAYALDSLEDASVLSEAELKSEIQKLNDRLVARGLRKS